MFKKNSSILFVNRPASEGCLPGRKLSLATFFLLIICLFGCQFIPPLPPTNLGEPGWKIQQGQVFWRSKKDAPEIAGELLVASHPDGRTFVQFTKTPLPFVVAQTTKNSWQIHFVPNNKTFSAHGNPPARLIWLYLPRCLAGSPPPKNWTQERLENNGFRFQNLASGELLEGYLNP